MSSLLFFRVFQLLTLVSGLLLLGAAPGYALDAGAVFTPGPPMNEARMNHNIAPLPDGKVIVFGGHTPGFGLRTRRMSSTRWRTPGPACP